MEDQQATENQQSMSDASGTVRIQAEPEIDQRSAAETEMDSVDSSATQMCPSATDNDQESSDCPSEPQTDQASKLSAEADTECVADNVDFCPSTDNEMKTFTSDINTVECPIPEVTSQLDISDFGDLEVENSDESDDTCGWKLDTLPTELLMHICNFLDARDIVCTLSSVCQSFYDLFSGDSYWKTRISKLCPKKYPVVARDNFNWKQSCIEREEQHQRWRAPGRHMHHFVFREGLFAPVDTVHLMQNGQILASGSRDRYLTVLDLKKYDPDKSTCDKDIRVHSDSKAHKGWIWSMTSQDNTLVTGSWDMYIKMWDMTSQCTLLQEYKCRSAVLCLHMERNLIVAGGYDKRLYLIDPREDRVKFKKFHRQPVLCVAADDTYFITGSEDKTIIIYDRRAGNVYKTIEVDDYILDMSYGDGQLWCGDKQGQVHLYDATQGSFNLVQSCDVGHRGKMTGVVHTPGSLFTCSTDNTIKILEPTIDPGVINTLTAHTGDVARLSYQNGVLASAGSDVSIGVWIPK